VQAVVARIRDVAGARCAVIHSMAPELARSVAERIESAVRTASTYLCSVGPTVGTHAGPGAVGFFWFTDDDVPSGPA